MARADRHKRVQRYRRRIQKGKPKLGEMTQKIAGNPRLQYDPSTGRKMHGVRKAIKKEYPNFRVPKVPKR
tara:strand:+ start:100 stop:309 length:210 start_codon:yes stop_codon:yes gene_type:complete